jgi:hypothetical protein
MAVTKKKNLRMRPYDTIEKSPRNRQLDSEEKKKKSKICSIQSVAGMIGVE